MEHFQDNSDSYTNNSTRTGNISTWALFKKSVVIIHRQFRLLISIQHESLQAQPRRSLIRPSSVEFGNRR